MLKVTVIISFITICSFAGVNGQVFGGWGRCPNISVESGFDVNSYMGTWYEYQRFFAIFELGVKCATANYNIIDDRTVRVVNRGINKWTGQRSLANGTATIPDPSVPAKLKVKFSEYSPEGDYWVISTDYDTYSLVYSCQDFYVFHTEIAWILTRRRDGIPDDVKQMLYQMLKRGGINTNNFRTTDQTGCSQNNIITY